MSSALAAASRFCSRAARIFARMSSSGEAVEVGSDSGADVESLFLRFLGPMEAWALARAPKEMLLSDSLMSSLGSDSESEELSDSRSCSCSLASESESESEAALSDSSCD